MTSEKPLIVARNLADWYLKNMVPRSDNDANSGQLPCYLSKTSGGAYYSSEWNLAFSIMGMLSAHQVFGDERYKTAADTIAEYLRTIQIFDPFHKQHYGAFREGTAQTTWSYTRDALSGAWGCLEYYAVTGQEEFLERAILWGKWFFANGLDETGWPTWGIFFDKLPEGMFDPEMHNELHGCFHGGSLNFFYRLYRATGDRQWVGPFFEKMADYFVNVIQQPDGFFRTVEKATGKVPPQDPQNELHRGNDDLGTLGLLGAWRVYPKPEYLDSIRKFLNAVFKKQSERPDGHFEQSCAAVPVILNILHETREVIGFQPPPGAEDRALEALFARQFPQTDPPEFAGSLDEMGDGALNIRSMCYSLIFLLKKYAGDTRFLTSPEYLAK